MSAAIADLAVRLNMRDVEPIKLTDGQTLLVAVRDERVVEFTWDMGLPHVEFVRRRIAVAIWEPIYGEDKIASEKPYQARLDTKGVWVVEGSLPKGWLGGVAIAEIAKDDGRILRVSHGK